MILLDTDHLTMVIDRQSTGHAALMARLDKANEFLSVPVVCVEEECKGWLAKIHRARYSPTNPRLRTAKTPV